MPTSPPPQKEETFHIARSRLIDAFARIETRLVKLLDLADRPIKNDTVATKLKTLRDAATPESLVKLTESLDQLAPLFTIRADLVHSAMTLVDEDGERFASFRNARESVNKAQKSTQITFKTLKAFADDLDRIAVALDAMKFTPPASPPPPLPGAATDP